ncbi:hypothetical protein NEAUS06_0334 [Nematocida ausubeli]|nr:hypothetical protein NEAUS06_0334 [Nematocida ausubeli]
MDPSNYTELEQTDLIDLDIFLYKDIISKYSYNYTAPSNISTYKWKIITDIFSKTYISINHLNTLHNIRLDIINTIIWQGYMQYSDKYIIPLLNISEYTVSQVLYTVEYIYRLIQSGYISLLENIFIWRDIITESEINLKNYFFVEEYFRNGMNLQKYFVQSEIYSGLCEFIAGISQENLKKPTLQELYNKKTGAGERYVEYGINLLMNKRTSLKEIDAIAPWGSKMQTWVYSFLGRDLESDKSRVPGDNLTPEALQNISILAAIKDHWEDILMIESEFLRCFSNEHINILCPMAAPLITPSFKSFRILQELVRKAGTTAAFMDTDGLYSLFRQSDISPDIKVILARRYIRILHMIKTVYNDKQNILIKTLLEDLQDKEKTVNLWKYRPIVINSLGIMQIFKRIRNICINRYIPRFKKLIKKICKKIKIMLIKFGIFVHLMWIAIQLNLTARRVEKSVKGINAWFWNTSIIKHISSWRIFSYKTYRGYGTENYNEVPEPVMKTLRHMSKEIKTVMEKCMLPALGVIQATGTLLYVSVLG